MTEIVSAAPLAVLRTRTSEKWAEYPPDVIPMFVAEMDVPLAPVIREALHAAIDRGDAGYVASRTRLPQAFADFAGRRWSWQVDPEAVFTTADVSMGIVEILRRVIVPGDGVVITPPIYPPFFELVPEAGGKTIEVPLLGSSHQDDASGPLRLDLAGLEEAFRSGAKAFLLCNPHNPIGHPHTIDELRDVASLAARYGVTVISDEIHAPLTQPGERFVPFLSVSDEAAEHGFAVLSASKAWNLAGLKCAVMVAAAPGPRSILAGMPAEVFWRTGQFGVLASVAAFESGEAWLDGLLDLLDGNRRLLGDLLSERVPAAGYRMPAAGYLAWIDFSRLGWTEPPARRILREAKVALQEGAPFGASGRDHARLNLACSPELLTEAIGRIAELR